MLHFRTINLIDLAPPLSIFKKHIIHFVFEDDDNDMIS